MSRNGDYTFASLQEFQSSEFIWAFFKRIPNLVSWLFRSEAPLFCHVAQCLTSEPSLNALIFDVDDLQQKEPGEFPDIRDIEAIFTLDRSTMVTKASVSALTDDKHAMTYKSSVMPNVELRVFSPEQATHLSTVVARHDEQIFQSLSNGSQELPPEFLPHVVTTLSLFASPKARNLGPLQSLQTSLFLAPQSHTIINNSCTIPQYMTRLSLSQHHQPNVI